MSKKLLIPLLILLAVFIISTRYASANDPSAEEGPRFMGSPLQEPVGPNLIQNNGFENGFEHWTYDNSNYNNGEWEVGHGLAFAGAKRVVLRVTNGSFESDQSLAIKSAAFDVEEHCTYQMRLAWGEDEVDFAFWIAKIFWYDSDNNLILISDTLEKSWANPGYWQEVPSSTTYHNVDAPVGAVSGELFINVHRVDVSAGASDPHVQFDEIVLKQKGDPSVQCFDTSLTFPVNGEIYGGWSNGSSNAISWSKVRIESVPGANESFSDELYFDAPSNPHNFTLENVPSGTYYIWACMALVLGGPGGPGVTAASETFTITVVDGTVSVQLAELYWGYDLECEMPPHYME